MAIVVGPGVIIGPGIVVGYGTTPPQDIVNFITEDSNFLISEVDDQFIKE